MILTDTHTHIYYHEGNALDEQMERCLKNDVKRLFLPNVDLGSISKIRSAVAAYPDNFFPMIGLHPCSVSLNYEEDLAKIKEVWPKVAPVAVGEIGIDLHWDKTTFEIQEHAFRIQIEWAKSAKIPIVIHCRNAFNEVFDVLEEVGDENLQGVFHCFTGNRMEAVRAIDMGMYLGIGGVITFKNAGLDKTLKDISLDHILLETDAPYLSPVPYRGKPNESSYLPFVAKKLADIYQLSVEEVAHVTTRNSRDLFKV